MVSGALALLARAEGPGDEVTRPSIVYVTGLDGWGEMGEPSQEDRESFCALVEARLQALYPTHTVEAYVDESALESRVETDDDEIDEDELCSWIGVDVWDEWCGGERAPEVRS